MAPSTEASAPKLPATADFNNFFNKVSLANARKTTLLSNMRAKHSLSRPAAGASSTPAQQNGTFSALTNPSATSSQPPPQPQPRRATADDQDVRFADPKLGIGYAPSQSEEQTSAATKELGRRLLGGRRTDPKTAAAQKRRAQDDESEEEEGRSGLGRKKKKRTRVDEDVEVEEHEDEAPDPAVELAEVVAEHVTVSQDGASQPDDAKRKKKRKNKKKKKAAEGGEGDEV